MISAMITVIRDDVEIDVEVSGQSENYGSANPYERGEHIADWSVDSPKGFDLTKEEDERALAALEREI